MTLPHTTTSSAASTAANVNEPHSSATSRRGAGGMPGGLGVGTGAGVGLASTGAGGASAGRPSASMARAISLMVR